MGTKSHANRLVRLLLGLRRTVAERYVLVFTNRDGTSTRWSREVSYRAAMAEFDAAIRDRLCQPGGTLSVAPDSGRHLRVVTAVEAMRLGAAHTSVTVR